MKSLFLIAILLYYWQLTAQPFEPVNKNASKEARQLLAYLYQISGKQIVSGHHNYNHRLMQFSERAYSITGKYPAIWGSDFIFSGSNKSKEVIEEAIKQYDNGTIVTLMWHAVRPMDIAGTVENEWKNSVQAELTDTEWQELITQGTPLYNKWLAQIDEVAEYLKILRDKNIPVLWRPYHEMNGIWFWWGDKKGEKGFKQLWINMYSRYVNYHKLNNLLWVWNTNAPRIKENDDAYDYANYFPGLDYVDVLAADVYNNDYKQSHHDDLMKLAAGKLISLGEVGQMPTPEILDKQPNWCWFMTWANFIDKANQPDEVKRLYNDKRVITKDELPGGFR